MRCKRCGNEFEHPGFQTNICGNCADDLRQEEYADKTIKEIELGALNEKDSNG